MLTWTWIIILLSIVLSIPVAALATNAFWTSAAIRQCGPSFLLRGTA
jgi:hypothetical protein